MWKLLFFKSISPYRNPFSTSDHFFYLCFFLLIIIHDWLEDKLQYLMQEIHSIIFVRLPFCGIIFFRSIFCLFLCFFVFVFFCFCFFSYSCFPLILNSFIVFYHCSKVYSPHPAILVFFFHYTCCVSRVSPFKLLRL